MQERIGRPSIRDNVQTMSDASRRFFANLLMAVGGLMTILCGGCTVFFLGTAILTSLRGSEGSNASDALSLGISAILVGGMPTVVGAALFLWGRRMKRQLDAQARRSPGDTVS